jgi:serine phosphatase RsbU (regulator of sigma subunit)
MPIGIVDDMENFTTQNIKIYTDDKLYMFSDGLPDQFGGANHKKFSYKRLRESLVNTNHGGMSDQKTKMETTMNNWMGDTSQTDDMLLVGFKIE